MNINEIVDEAYELIGDPDRRYWDTKTMAEIAKEGIRELAERGLFKTTSTITAIDIQEEYLLPLRPFRIEKVEGDGDIDYELTPDGKLVLGDYTGQVKVTYYYYPDDDEVRLLDPSVLKYYIAYQALLRDDNPVNQQKAAIYKELFERRVRVLTDTIFRKGKTGVKEIPVRYF